MFWVGCRSSAGLESCGVRVGQYTSGSERRSCHTQVASWLWSPVYSLAQSLLLLPCPGGLEADCHPPLSIVALPAFEDFPRFDLQQPYSSHTQPCSIQSTPAHPQALIGCGWHRQLIAIPDVSPWKPCWHRGSISSLSQSQSLQGKKLAGQRNMDRSY